ncbi:hypothetical protein F2Q68_00007356 [Brassica cretica]|uniref:Uncharacterized protein n=1 Tax=Brassica cretica TaxID=69181 RepID=A0A8S9KZN3_BRACR|nr:hypothetical protein F2Q68_00007356 [Brassica cretica]
MTPSSLSMTLSYVSLRLLSQAVVSVDDSVVCLTPSSRSVHLLCQTVVSLAPSSLSLGLLSRSRVWNLFEMCFKILDQVHVLESCLCSILLYVLEIDEYDLIVFCSVIGIALPQIDRCCVEEAMECFILSGTHASLSEGFNLIKARGGRLVIEEDNVFDVMKVVVFYASSSGLSVGLLRKPLVPPRTVVTLNPRISASRSSEER